MKKRTLAVLAIILIIVQIQTITAFAFNKPPNTGNPPTFSEMNSWGSPFSDFAKYPMDNGIHPGGKLYNKPEGVKLPAMGFNTWNAFGTNHGQSSSIPAPYNTIGEETAKGIADSFIRLGLDKVGYQYIVLDDGTYRSGRGAAPYNELQNNTTRFPSGFPALADYIHSKGLKFGMYQDIGTSTCAGGQPGTWGYEDSDALNFARWGVDYIKYDYCSFPWDHAQSATNVWRTHAPLVRSITVSDGNAYTQKLNALDGETKGRAIKDAARGGVYNIGTSREQRLGDVYGELVLTVEVPAAGNYELSLEYASTTNGLIITDSNTNGTAAGTVTTTYGLLGHPGIGRTVQLDINGSRVIDGMILAGTGTSTANNYASPTFSTVPLGTFALKEGENTLRICNFRRRETGMYGFAAFWDAMQKAMKETNREEEMVFSMCEWGFNQPWYWGWMVGDSWRTTEDIFYVNSTYPGQGRWNADTTVSTGTNGLNDIPSITWCYNATVGLDEYAGIRKGWNDPDMLCVGNKNTNTTTAPNSTISSAATFNSAGFFTYDQDESHFNAWCMMNSPLMLGTDLRRVEIGSNVHKVISNPDVIALNQDALGVPCKRIKTDNESACIDYYNYTATGTTRDYFQRRISIEHLDVLVKPLAGGDVAVMFFNLDNKARSIDLTFDEIVNGKDANGISIKHRMAPGAYDAFTAAAKYYFKDLRTKNVVEVAKSGTFTLTDNPATVTAVSCKDGTISANLAPYASVTYRISLAEPQDITYGIAFDYAGLEPDASIRALATMTNASDEALSAIVIIALYNSDGLLENIKVSDAKELSPSGMVTLEAKLTMPGDVAGKTLKAFLWDAETFVPLAPAIKLGE